MIKLLDHGYINLVESWGSDERIIEAARMSTNKGFLGWGPIHEPRCPLSSGGSTDQVSVHDTAIQHHVKCICKSTAGDEKLLRYLYEHRHHTPFEMAGLIIEVQAPIFVFREWHRHRTQSYNELSARYTPMPDLNYVPEAARCQLSAGTNKQAAGVGGELTLEGVKNWTQKLDGFYFQAEQLYQQGLRLGIPKELARLCIPVGRYSRMRASANLRNWLGFLTLRMDPAAQWEIRQYANAVGTIIAKKFPRTWELFIEKR